MYIADPAWLLLLLCLPLPWLLFRRKGFLGHSNLGLFKSQSRGRFLHRVPAALLCLSFVALTVALAQPQHGYEKPNGKILSRDVVFGIDVSGSMTTEFVGTIPAADPRCLQQLGQLPPALAPTPPANADPTIDPTKTRQSAAAGSVENFICQSYLTHSGDRIGLLNFDDNPRWMWPLTTDLKMPFRQAEFIPYITGGGTNFGEIPPGPIDFGAAMFKQIGQAKSRVFILVTDGEDSLGTQVVQRLESVIRQNNMHFYVIGVAEDLVGDHADIATVAEQTGGAVFQAQSPMALNQAVATVDRLTASPVEVETTPQHTDLFWIFADAFIILFLVGLAGEAVVIRQ